MFVMKLNFRMGIDGGTEVQPQADDNPDCLII